MGSPLKKGHNQVPFLLASLKNCAKNKDLHQGTKLHAYIRTNGLLAKDVYLGNTLISMYAKCGALSKAREVFNGLPLRRISTWNALLSGYTKHGLGKETLDCFCQMQSQGLSPDAFTYACILKACSITKEVELGEQIHDEIVNQGLLGKDVVLGNALVDMYAKCGLLTKAQEVLDKLPVRDVVSWNVLISAYAQQGQSIAAMVCYDQMRQTSLSPDATTYASVLKACGITKEVDKGKKIHEEVATLGLLGKDVVLGTALVDMYAKCGELSKARQVLEDLLVRNVVSWNALIAGYVQQEQSEEALVCYDQMRHEGISPDTITYISIMKVYGITKQVNKGRQLHEEIASQGLLGKNTMLGNALVDMYAKSGMLDKARQVLDELPLRDAVSWSALIAGYTQQGQVEEAIDCYQQMQDDGLSPNAITYTCILKACGILKEVKKGKQIREDIASQSLLGKDVVLGNALIDMYAKCGMLTKARQVLDELPVRNEVSWNALIAGYAEQEQGENVLVCYNQMLREGLSSNPITYVSILKACALDKEVNKCEQIHEEIATRGLLGESAVLGNALVDMYVKCGSLTRARQVLEELPIRDVASWNALMTGYAQEGRVEEAKDCFERMQSEGLVPDTVSWNTVIGGYAQQGDSAKALGCFGLMQDEGITPDDATLICVLSACGHSGLVDEGQILFEIMEEKFGISPDIDHYASMVDLYARTGHFDRAMAVIEKRQSCNHLALWLSLLCACRKWGNVKLARLAFEHAVKIDEHDAGVYVCMKDIYVAAGMEEKAQEIESMRVKTAAWQLAGPKWRLDEVCGDFNSFLVGDNQHAERRRK